MVVDPKNAPFNIQSCLSLLRLDYALHRFVEQHVRLAGLNCSPGDGGDLAVGDAKPRSRVVPPVRNVVSPKGVALVLDHALKPVGHASGTVRTRDPRRFLRCGPRCPRREGPRSVGTVRTQIQKLRELHKLDAFFHPARVRIVVATLDVAAKDGWGPGQQQALVCLAALQ